eukprot:scaffold535_cov260-Pinguiococcus_pyrenoidosus.AAC.6
MKPNEKEEEDRRRGKERGGERKKKSLLPRARCLSYLPSSGMSIDRIGSPSHRSPSSRSASGSLTSWIVAAALRVSVPGRLKCSGGAPGRTDGNLDNAPLLVDVHLFGCPRVKRSVECLQRSTRLGQLLLRSSLQPCNLRRGSVAVPCPPRRQSPRPAASPRSAPLRRSLCRPGIACRSSRHWARRECTHTACAC